MSGFLFKRSSRWLSIQNRQRLLCITLLIEGGKQIDTRSHLAIYDFAARTRHASLPIFHRPDHIAEKYYHLSPYTYCAGDPLNYIDPTGEDYEVIIDDNSIVVRATYLVLQNSYDAALKSANIIMNNNSCFELKYSDGDNDVTLPISFDISIEIVEPLPNRKDTNSITSRYELSEISKTVLNVFSIVPDDTLIDKNGISRDGVIAYVSQSRKETETGAHEMGHTLGCEHSYKGLMTAGSSDEKRSNYFSLESMNQIIQNPIKNKNSKYAGKGTIINNSKYDIETLKKGKIRKATK